MTFVPLDTGNSSSLIVFPTDHMRNVASQIHSQAIVAQSNHDITWQQIQTSITNHFDPQLQQTVLDCVKPYADRIRAAYDWQLDLATALHDAADQVDTSEGTIQQSFMPGRGPR